MVSLILVPTIDLVFPKYSSESRSLHLSTLTHCCHMEPCVCGVSSREGGIGYNSLDLPVSADFGVSLPSDFSSLLGPRFY